MRLDPDKDVAKKRRFETSEEIESYIKEIIVDLKDLINNTEDIDETGLDVQIQADTELVTNNLILLDNELMKENVANETIMELFEEIIEPLNSDPNPKSKQVYEVLSEFLKQHFNAETEKTETENAETEKAPAPAGGSKSAKKRFKTQKRRKGKSASKSVKRRRRKRSNKSKLNKKRETKRSRK